ncbi:hypothetical protein MKW98_002696 [Papaver atlanticum]|uniref:Protein ROOT INITIATION DEFECTIVE 3-like n=1 Tax=Papaver atlanticum TaxID=357466 RepID=A0AAD4XCK8_9MAGN|nr:hypothetical protein MKW98_002696 [Papaver atlanticum]
MVREALVVCSDKSLGAGITIWDMESGDHLLHIPTCASPSHGFLCLRNQFLVASQIHKHGSFGGGAIFIWPLNKPQAPLRSYPIEAVGPLSCTEDGLYLAGGAPSGNAYVWEVLSGRMLRSWRAHHKSVNCIAFTADSSLLISGSDDGSICIWSMIRKCRRKDFCQQSRYRTGGELKYYIRRAADCTQWAQVIGSITALSFSMSGLWLISASEDCTACLWDVRNWAVARRFTHAKGQITNLLVIPRSSLPFVENNQRVSYQPRVSLLDKYQQPSNTSRGTVAILPSYCSLEDDLSTAGFSTIGSMNNQILELEQGSTPAAIQMKVETNVENRLWATSMTRHMTDMNKHLRSRLLDLMQCRLVLTPKIDCPSSGKGKKLKAGTSPPLRVEET